jgi:predicted nucleotidyltransferase
MTPATEEKRRQLSAYIQQVLEPEPAVKGVVGIGSIATGHMRPDSDIDAVIFLDPLDLYIAPAEAIWSPEDDTYHSIFDDNVEGIELDFTRLDWKQWSDPEFEWPEGRRAELASGWLAHDPAGEVARLLAQRTAYPDDVLLARLDEALVWLDQHLKGEQIRTIWDALGPAIAHDRLEAAYDYLVSAIFAANRQWRIWRNREMQVLLQLPWLPRDFADRVLSAANAPGVDQAGYNARAQMLQSLFEETIDHLIAMGLYSSAAIDQAFIRSGEEPGRAWNMAEWNKFHLARAIPGNGKAKVSS